MTVSTATQGPTDHPRIAADIDEGSLDVAFETRLPHRSSSEARGRWFDLCFRLIILALAALWLLTPPAGNEHRAADEKAVATTR